MMGSFHGYYPMGMLHPWILSQIHTLDFWLQEIKMWMAKRWIQSFKMAAHKSMGDVTVATSIFYT